MMGYDKISLFAACLRVAGNETISQERNLNNMGNKRYSNKGVNTALKAQALAAAEEKSKKQTWMVVGITVAVVLVTVILALVLGGIDSTPDSAATTGATTTAKPADTTAKPEPNADMTAISKEIDSLRIEDFTAAAEGEKTEYVKISFKDFGDVIIRLRGDIAPKTVENFQKLVSEKFYDGLTIHRVVKNFVIQGGDPKGDGTGGAKDKVVGEFSANKVQNDLSHIAGVISMARKGSDMNSATSQFFICNADASSNLDGKYAGFGYVVAGMEVVLTITDVEVKSGTETPKDKIVINSITFVTPVNAETEAPTDTVTEPETTANTEASGNN